MKSCCGDVTSWVLLEVPPHGGGGGPRMVAGVAEWAMGNADGGTRAHTHAVGVRAHGAVRVPQTWCGDVAEEIIWAVVGHWLFFDGAKIRKTRSIVLWERFMDILLFAYFHEFVK